jgi:hypothetical protein
VRGGIRKLTSGAMALLAKGSVRRHPEKPGHGKRALLDGRFGVTQLMGWGKLPKRVVDLDRSTAQTAAVSSRSLRRSWMRR